MADTTFVDKQTVIEASWLNEVNASVHRHHIALRRYVGADKTLDNTRDKLALLCTGSEWHAIALGDNGT